MAKRRKQGEPSPPMQFLLSMLKTSTDELERELLIAKLRSIIEADLLRGVYVVRK